MKDSTETSSTAYMGGASALGSMDGFEDYAVNHGTKECVRRKELTDGIESFGSPLNRRSKGTDHKIRSKRPQRCVHEFAGHHNIGDSDTIARVVVFTAKLAGKRLRHRQQIADNRLASGRTGASDGCGRTTVI